VHPWKIPRVSWAVQSADYSQQRIQPIDTQPELFRSLVPAKNLVFRLFRRPLRNFKMAPQVLRFVLRPMAISNVVA
jgi:hypothetical protein